LGEFDTATLQCGMLIFSFHAFGEHQATQLAEPLC
jgi:hypothetical protein